MLVGVVLGVGVLVQSDVCEWENVHGKGCLCWVGSGMTAVAAPGSKHRETAINSLGVGVVHTESIYAALFVFFVEHTPSSFLFIRFLLAPTTTHGL